MLQILEVAIGLVLIFTLVSLAASVLVEWLSGILAMRGKLLWKGIGRMVGSAWEGKLCEHPLLQSLTRRTWFDAVFPYLGRAKPSYVPARTFSAALLGVLQRDGSAAPGSDLVTAVGSLADGHLKRALQPLVDQAGKDLAKAQDNIEHWFDTSMDRVTGWYKRWSQLVLFLLGLGTALWFGIDSIRIGESLWTDDLLRDQMVEVAGEMVESEECKALVADEDPDAEADSESARECLETYRARLAEMKLPLVPFTPEAGEASAPGSKRYAWPWVLRGWSLLPALALAAGLFWLDHRHRQPEDGAEAAKPRPSVRVLALIGRGVIVLLVGLAAAGAITGVVERYWHPGLLEWLGAHLPGFLLTAVAVSFGAPFWFDLLGRLVKLRTSGARPQPPAPGQPTVATPAAPTP